MKKKWLLAIGLTLVLMMVGLCGCSEGGVSQELPSGTQLNLNTQQEGIWVTGKGEVSVTPDVATLRLGIQSQKATVAEAQVEASEAMDKVMAALKESGLDEKDIQTQYFEIRQRTKWDSETDEEIVIGYQVTNMVGAKIRDIDKVGAIIDAAAKAGGDLVRMHGVSFSVEDPSTYYEKLGEKAKVAKLNVELDWARTELAASGIILIPLADMECHVIDCRTGEGVLEAFRALASVDEI